MGEEEVSLTGQAVAVERSRLVRPTSRWGDAHAQARLCAGMSPALTLSPPLAAHVAARTLCIDRCVLEAVGDGTEQVVVLGAGYDDRALRFASPGVRFFELDHPATQADKRARLSAMGADGSGLTLAAVDFRVDDVGDVLDAAAHEAARPTLFIAEGLLVYLDEQDIVALLGAIGRRAAGGSALVATLAVHPAGLDSEVVLDRANAVRARARAEPWRTILPAAQHLDLVVRAGWTVTASVDDADLVPAAVPGRSLSVVAHP